MYGMPNNSYEFLKHHFPPEQEDQGQTSPMARMEHKHGGGSRASNTPRKYIHHQTRSKLRRCGSNQTRKARGIQPHRHQNAKSIQNPGQERLHDYPAHVREHEHPEKQISFLVHEKQILENYLHLSDRFCPAQSHHVLRY